MSKRACNWRIGNSEPFYMLRLMGINSMIAMYVALNPGLSQKVYFICGIHCIDAIFSTQEAILQHMQDGESPTLCCFDLKKAFDSIKYTILFGHLFKIGIKMLASPPQLVF